MQTEYGHSACPRFDALEELGIEDPGRPIGHEAKGGEHQETEGIGDDPCQRITVDRRVPDVLNRSRDSVGISHLATQHMSSSASAVVHLAYRRSTISQAPIADTGPLICAVFGEREL